MRQERSTRKATAADRARSLELLVAALLGTSTRQGTPIGHSPATKASSAGDEADRRETP